jgi:transcriptional regulator with GAF, ATPase, and Fis domain
MAGGNYSVYWEGLGEGNRMLNQESIAGELVKMRDEIQKMKQQDELSIWKTEGLAKFSDIIREQQDDLKAMYNRLLSEIVGYLGVQQGAMFAVSEDESQGVKLVMQACYAYERSESNEQIIEPGVGMVGQCFLDGEIIYMKEVPEEYVNIASGLGDTIPKSILLIPLKANDVVEGVLELASLEAFKDHEIAFLLELGEIIASTVSRMKAVIKTSELLQQSQQQAEEMRSQEEEMRQNMEELQATQEQMVRKNQEFEELLQKSAEREKELLEELSSLKKGKQ